MFSEERGEMAVFAGYSFFFIKREFYLSECGFLLG